MGRFGRLRSPFRTRKPGTARAPGKAVRSGPIEVISESKPPFKTRRFSGQTFDRRMTIVPRSRKAIAKDDNSVFARTKAIAARAFPGRKHRLVPIMGGRGGSQLFGFDLFVGPPV